MTLGRLFRLQCKETVVAIRLRGNDGLNQAAAIGMMCRTECRLAEVGGKAEGKSRKRPRFLLWAMGAGSKTQRQGIRCDAQLWRLRL